MIGHPNLKFWSNFQDATPTNIVDGSAGAIVGAPTSQAGIVGISRGFGATGDRLNFGNPAFCNFGSGDWSLCCWFKRNSLGSGAQMLFNKDEITDGTRQFILGLDGNENGTRQILVAMFVGTNFVYGLQNTANTSDTTTWHHVMAGRIGSTYKIIVDGVDQAVTVGGTFGAMANTTSPLTIGGRSYNSQSCRAEICQPVIFNKAPNVIDARRLMYLFKPPLTRS